MTFPWESGPEATCPSCGWDESIEGKDVESVKVATANVSKRGSTRACLNCGTPYVVSRTRGTYLVNQKRLTEARPAPVPNGEPKQRPVRRMPLGQEGMRKAPDV